MLEFNYIHIDKVFPKLIGYQRPSGDTSTSFCSPREYVQTFHCEFYSPINIARISVAPYFGQFHLAKLIWILTNSSYQNKCERLHINDNYCQYIY